MDIQCRKLIGFLNARSKTIKIGKGWRIIVKYVLPVVIFLIAIGGLSNMIRAGSSDQLIVIVILSAMLLISCLIFTVLPPKNPDWDHVDERI